MRFWRFVPLFFLLTTAACTKSDEALLDRVRANAVEVFREQASWALPESFYNSARSPADKERVVEQLANATGACLADGLATYAESSDVPLAEMVSEDGTFRLKGGDDHAFDLSLSTCIERAWEAAGVVPE